MSLRTRLLVGLAFVALMLGLTTFFVTSTLNAHLVRQIDSQLRGVTTSGRERFGGPGDSGRDDGPNDGRREQPSTLYYAELDEDGTLLVRLVPNLDDGADVDDEPVFDVAQLLAAEDGEPFSVEATGSEHRWRVLVTEGPDHREVSALSLADVDETGGRLVLVELIAAVGVLGAMALVGWWVMRLGVRPIGQMTVVATVIASGDLSHRVRRHRRAPRPANSGRR